MQYNSESKQVKDNMIKWMKYLKRTINMQQQEKKWKTNIKVTAKVAEVIQDLLPPVLSAKIY